MDCTQIYKDIQQGCIQFYKDIQTDITVATEGTDSQDIRNERIESIWFRTLGVLLLFIAAIGFFSISSFISASIVGIKAVLAHDLIQIGCSKSRAVRDGFSEQINAVLTSDLSEVFTSMVNGITGKAPSHFSKTLVIGPLYKALIQK